jgi:hypothetical protein
MDVSPDDGPDVVHGEHVVGRRHGDDRRAVLPTDGEGVMPASELLGQKRRGSGIEREAVEVDVLEPDLASESACFVDFRLGRSDASTSRLLGGTHRRQPTEGRARRGIAHSPRAAVSQLRFLTFVPPLAAWPRYELT